MQGPHVIGVWDAKVLIEPLIQRHEIWMIAQMPFAKYASSITLRFEHFGYSGLSGMEPSRAVWHIGSMYSDSIWIATGQDTSSRCRTNGLGGVEVSKYETIMCQLV